MKSGYCPKCNSPSESNEKRVALLVVQNRHGRIENIVLEDGSTQSTIVKPYFCSKCNYVELYQE